MAQHHHLHHRPLSRSDVVMLLMAGLIGCAAPRAPQPQRPAASAPAETLSVADPCAQRLHDLSGGLLLYFAQNQKLPPNLSVLELPGGVAGAGEALVCPVSNHPYVYDPRGLTAPDGKSRLIVYDSVPSHAGRRWAITMIEGDAGQPQTDVIALPERHFESPTAP